jgi:hypothetical protein
MIANSACNPIFNQWMGANGSEENMNIRPIPIIAETNKYRTLQMDAHDSLKNNPANIGIAEAKSTKARFTINQIFHLDVIEINNSQFFTY